MSCQQPVLSIVVPSYNTARFVDECAPTFLDERFVGKIRVLFIDDGATDNTKDKVMGFVRQFPEIASFHHKENGGHGSVINLAVHELIQTPYFKIIDGDDWSNVEALLSFVDFLSQNDFDMVVSDYVIVKPNEEMYRKGFLPEGENRFKGYHLSIHSLTYKTSLFKAHGIKVREGVFYEDNEYVFYPLEFVKTIGYFDRPIYFYRLGDDNQSVSLKSMLKHIDDYEQIKDDIAQKYQDWVRRGINESVLRYTEYSLKCFYVWIFQSMVLRKRKRRIIKNVVTNELKAMPNVYMSVKKEKAFRFLASAGFSFLSIKRFILKRRLRLT